MGQFRILSLDGGGIRGAATAGFLAEIERKANCKIADHFDLIAGTSTGAIIAAALALGESAATVEKFYQEKGPGIFRRPSMCFLTKWGLGALSFAIRLGSLNHLSFDAKLLFRPKYDAKILEAALREVMKDKKLGDAGRRLVIPSVDVTTGHTVVFKTPHIKGYVRDREYRAVDAVLASAAAPTYFSPATITEGSAYVDGGLWANNPAICAYVEAVAISQKCKRPELDVPFDPLEVTMLSVGTGKSPYHLARARGREGMLHWGLKLLDVMGGSQSQGVDHQMEYLLGKDRYHRVDFTLPDKWPLDAVEHTGELIHLGQHQAIKELATVQTRFLRSKASKYTPFALPSPEATHQ